MKDKGNFTSTFCNCDVLVFVDTRLQLFQCGFCLNEYVRVFQDPDVFYKVEKKGEFNETCLETGTHRWGKWKRS